MGLKDELELVWKKRGRRALQAYERAPGKTDLQVRKRMGLSETEGYSTRGKSVTAEDYCDLGLLGGCTK